MNIAALLGTVGQVISTITGVIATAEALFPGSKRGADKLRHVLDKVRDTAAEIPELAEKAEAFADEMRPVVGAIVDTFNRFGIFKRSPDTPAAPLEPVHDVSTVPGLEREPKRIIPLTPLEPATTPGGSESQGKPDPRVGVGPEEGAA